MIHLYYGFGKGKTTAAFGLAMRMAGRDRPVLFAQFLKNDTSGEIQAGKRIPQITFLHPEAFLDASSNRKLLQSVHHILQDAAPYALVVLDEVLDAMLGGAFELDRLLEIMDICRERDVELVLTAHKRPPAAVRRRAAYITEFRKRRHPFDRGIPARPGVEF